MGRTHLALPWVGWLVAGMALSAYGWSDHTLGSHVALAVMPEVATAVPVRAESLRSFLAAEQHALALVLREEEAWARANVPHYPPLPDGLFFRTGGAPERLTGRFLAALRIDPRISLALYVQPPFGSDVRAENRLPAEQVTFLKTLTFDQPFRRLSEGEEVAAIDVVATASDEPDYGMDIGLWENNGTSFGQAYGMGRQPFGNPVLEYSSQAPFHMGFYHEEALVYALVPALKRTYPEVRIHQFTTLARFAFATGHAYWGWRFAGWGLHYVQDLTQPYHARVLPGVSVARVLSAAILAAVGKDGPEKELRQLVTNRHLALENYEKHELEAALLDDRPSDPVLLALADRMEDARYAPFTMASVRTTLTSESAGRADATDAALQRWLPGRMIGDPSYVFGQTEPDVNAFAAVESEGPEASKAMQDLLARLLRPFGIHSRNYLRAVRAR